jgi:hypothetical protein
MKVFFKNEHSTTLVQNKENRLNIIDAMGGYSRKVKKAKQLHLQSLPISFLT